MHRVLTVLLWALAILGFPRQVFLTTIMGALPTGMTSTIPDELQEFYTFAATQLPRGCVVSLVVPPKSWNNGYAYPYFRASYSLPSDTVIPVISDNGDFDRRLAEGEYVLAWHANIPLPGYKRVASAHGGTIWRR